MKTGVYTGNIMRWGESRYQMLRAAGYDCIDYNLADTETAPYTLPEKEFEAYLRHEKSLAEKSSIEIFQIHGPWRWPPQEGTAAERQERMEKMTRSLQAASLIGCKNWVVHPIMPFGIEDIGTGNEQATWDMNMQFMSALLEQARELGVTICLENMPMTKFSLGSPDDILRFVKAIDDEHFKICLDTGHVSVFPNLTPGDALRRLGEEVRVLHVHDNDGRFDRHWMPYYGVIDWADFGRAIREVKFQGVLSLEVSPPENMPLSAAEAMYASMAQIARAITEI